MTRSKQGKTTCNMSAIPGYGLGLAGSFTLLPQKKFSAKFLVLQVISDVLSILEMGSNYW